MKLDLSVLNTGIYEYPKFAEKRGKKYIEAGADNQYFEYLFELFNTSAIHNAIVNGTADMIAGRGTYAEDWEKNDGTKEAWLRLNDLFGGDLVYKSALDLKLYGQYYWCLTWNQARTRITSVQHMPAHTMRSGIADEKGHVSEYLYKSDWNDKREKEKAYAAFDLKDRTAPQVVYQVKRYSPKYHYYGIPDYIGATNYVELDRQISSFHLNNVKNGMFPGWAINFRNGIPTDEEREAIERKVKAKFQGPEAAGNIIITFNEGADTTPELTALESNGNHDMFQYLSEELNNKILSGHRVTSPLLFGVRGGNGFGSNADELATAYDIFNRTVIAPFQQIITKSVETVLAVSEQPLSVQITPQAPADFIDNDEKVEMSAESADWLISQGEELDPEQWELIDSRQVDYADEARQDALWTFAQTVTSRPGAKDEQDNDLIKIRYRYAPNSASADSREFCKKMVAANKIYRKRDIDLASERAVNPGFGPNGADTYDIWLFKGGANCHHYWMRETYLQTGGKISVNEARKLINQLPPNERPQYRIPENDPRVAKRPIDMPNQGYLNPR